jgi:hypothetical protein
MDLVLVATTSTTWGKVAHFLNLTAKEVDMSIFKTKPLVVTVEDQKTIPIFPYPFKGMHTRPNVNSWMHDSKLFHMGTCDHAPDMDDATFELEADKCEIFYCAKGSLRLLWEDDKGNQGDLRCKEGEHMWLPGGYKYTLKATGEQAKNIWCTTVGVVFSEEKLNEWHKIQEERFPDFAEEMKNK